MVYSVYDLIIKIYADSRNKLKEIITSQARRVKKVRSTTTIIVSNEIKQHLELRLTRCIDPDVRNSSSFFNLLTATAK